MSALEKDAAERAENRRKNKIQADELKAKGNDAFHQQLYEQAIDYYTQGLKIKKDYDILYTNRAQVYVKQGRYQDAIDDCEWALKVKIEGLNKIRNCCLGYSDIY
jgi:tetratricopeptide (TPR) repeat protein